MARIAQSEQAPRGNLALRHHRHAEALSIRRVKALRAQLWLKTPRGLSFLISRMRASARASKLTHYWMKEGAQVRTRIQYWSLSGIGAQTVAGALLYAAVKFSTPINYDLVAA